MGQAVVDALLDDLAEQAVRAERGGHQMVDAGVGPAGLGGQVGEVVIPVTAGPQEVRGDHHRGRPGRDAGVDRRPDGGLGQLHVGRLHVDQASGRPPPGHERLVPPVGLVASRPVIDDHDPERAPLIDHAPSVGPDGANPHRWRRPARTGRYCDVRSGP